MGSEPGVNHFRPSVRPLALSAVSDAAVVAGSANFVAPQPAWLSPLPGLGGGGTACWSPSLSQLACGASLPPPNALLVAALLMGPVGRGAGASDVGVGPPWFSSYGGGNDAWQVPGLS
jgi:hypothetical protein